MDQRLGAGPQARAYQHAIRTQHQRGSKAAAVGDAAGGDQQRVRAAPRQQVGDLGHQRYGRASCAVAAGLGALGDDDVGAGVQRGFGVPHVLHLADQQPCRGLDGGSERARIAERQHHRDRRMRQGDIQRRRLLRQ
jgi:hypothetical protein